MDYVRKLGWELVREIAPSLNYHHMPMMGRRHQLSSSCWCEPALQGEPQLSPPYTIVHHHEAAP